jgi:transglutaminase-like putative cysteine protease
MSAARGGSKALPHPLAPDLRVAGLVDILGLCASLLLVVTPHMLRAPLWIGAFITCLYAWRTLAAAKGLPLPPRWLLFAITAAALGSVWIEYRTLFGRGPGILLLAVFSGLKLLETRTHRDAAMVAFLCYFLIITNFLFTQTIPTALLMCVALVVITTTVVGLNAPQRLLRANLRTAGLLLAHAAPAALVLFLLFPRVQGPLWGLPQEAFQAVTGLSETMSPGNFASLAQSDAIAFRAEFKGDTPAQRFRYWRGPVLWDFDGRTWRMGSPSLAQFETPQGSGRSDYAIILEAHDRPWLFSLETAASQPERSRYTMDGQFLSIGPVRTRLRYEMSSLSQPQMEAREEAWALRRALRVPAGFNPRSTELAGRLRDGAADDREILQRAIDFLRAGEYGYTLEPPLLGQHSVDEFLFTTKAGFCEHFASAFVFLMRAAGVPARVVTGYQGGDLNPIDQIITVRQSEAHAWAEVYLRDSGWIRVDPTAAAVPNRIEVGLSRAVPAGEALPFLMRPQFEWLRSLRYNWEAMTHRWNLWVLGYNPDRQRDLLSIVGMKDADWRNLTMLLFSVLGALTALLAVWAMRNYVRPDPVQTAWLAFCRKLAASGLKRAPHEGPRDYAERAAQRLPPAETAIRGIAALYIALRYGADRPEQEIDEFRRRVREFRSA